MFIGFVPLGSALDVPVLTVNSSQVPMQSSTTPSYRVYGPTGLMATGALSAKETGAVTGATNAAPIVVTAVAHGLTTGMSVTISGVLGNTAANGTFTITVLTADTFSLNGSTGNGMYASGGVWVTTGYYHFSFTPISGNGFVAGGWYDVLVMATVGGNTVEYQLRFGCI